MPDRRTEEERRAIRERRRPKERRRHSDSRVAAIEVTDSDLRVAILNRGSDDSSDRVEGLKHPWRHEADSLESKQGRLELTAALRHICVSQNLTGSQIRFVLGGKYCVTRALLGSTEEVKSHLQQLQQRSQLYLLLGTGEKVIVSNSKPLDARHTYAVAAIANAKTIDAIYSASEQAGLFVDSIEPALVANSRVIGRLEGASIDPCLLIHIDKETVEIGVSQTGRLLLEYRPGNCDTSSELEEVVRTHLNRLERHIGRILKQPPPKLEKIYLTGEGEELLTAKIALAKIPGIHPIIANPQKVQATWVLTEGIEASTTITLLGSLLGTYLPPSETDAPNFMDHITAITREPIKPILIRSLIPLAAVLFLAVGIFFYNYRQHLLIDRLNTQLDALAEAQTQTRELQLRQAASLAKLAQLEFLFSQIKSPPHAEMMRRIARCMPSDVWVNSLLATSATMVELRGSSFLEAGVFDFVRWLELAPGLKNVALRSTKSSQSRSGPTIEFDIGLNYTDFEEPISEVARHE